MLHRASQILTLKSVHKNGVQYKHYQKALYHEKFFHDIKQNYTDWAITGIFYSALHLVDAFLARKKLYPKDHKERTNYVGKIKELKPLFHHYRSLYDYSVNARYNMIKFSTADIEQIYSDYFIFIKNTIIKILKKVKKFPLLTLPPLRD